jgi:hypothetical protein
LASHYHFTWKEIKLLPEMADFVSGTRITYKDKPKSKEKLQE